MARKVGNIPLITRVVASCETPDAKYPGLKASSSIIPIGFQRTPINRPFHFPTRFDPNIDIPLRDGVKLRTDVFRPVYNTKLRALLVWSPYGKSGAAFFTLELVPGRSGVTASRPSACRSLKAWTLLSG